MQTHVKVLGVLLIIFGAFSLLLAFGGSMVLGLLSNMANHSGDADANTSSFVLGILGMFAGAFFGVIGAVQIITGFGIVTFKSWGRILGIVCCGLSLFSVPIGTILGAYGLWVLFNKETEALFKNGGMPAGSTPGV